MPKLQLINEYQLDDWVSKNDREAQTLIVELVSKLVSVSCPNATHQSFPLHVNQPGPDGEIVTEFGYKSFIPDGRSFWEVKTSRKAGTEATEAYDYYTKTIPEDVRKVSSFIFVTPRSSAHDWQNTWTEKGIAKWIKTREDQNEWNAVKVINGAILTDWLSFFPALGQWFASRVLGLPSGFETGYSRWELLRSYGDPPPLCHELFTTGRQEASEKLSAMLIQQESSRLRIDTRYPDHVADFVAAYLQTLDEETQPKFLPRVLIFSSEDGWREACNLQERHVFVADFDINSKRGSQLLQLATSSGHAVVYSGYPGGPPHGNSCEIFQPQVHGMKEALVKAGYPEERARGLTNKSGRDLNLLLRLIQDVSAHPDWATQSQAADLAIAQLIGQWKDENPGDQQAIEELSGNGYGEWIIRIRQAASAKSAPLELAIGRWKFTSRYEPWLYLGGLIGAEVLERFKALAIKVLSEPDPRLELRKDQRHAASIYGKERAYSSCIREGIAETLALLGSHGQSLACRGGLGQEVATLVVRELLAGADSHRWASLNDVLPLLSEAAPDEFLRAVGGASEKPDEPFSGVFSEEGDMFHGGSFMTGLLWALESLAWSDQYLMRVCGILADLAAVDPGGNYSNRPDNSLRGILLPWLPQTVAGADRRHAAVRSIAREHPEIGWKLILQLLPQNHSVGHPTHRPKWRDFIPEYWKDGVTNGHRWEDEGFYADLAMELAGNDLQKLAELLPFYFYIHSRFSNFMENYRNRLLSEDVLNLPEEQRLALWTDITNKTSNHRKYADSDAWMVPEEMLQQLDEVADKLKPQEPEVRHRRLFSGRDFDLYDEKGNWEEQRQRLLEKRIEALKDIEQRGGAVALKNFWRAVESPQEVGNACGTSEALANDEEYLPVLLESEKEADFRFAAAYIWRRFHTNSWDWVDGLDRSEWSVRAKAEFFAQLPSMREVWQRAESELAADRVEYWKRVRVHPSRDHLEGFDHAIAQLLANGRADVAIQCFWLGDLWTGLYPELALQALEQFDPNLNRIDAHAIQEIFEHLQEVESIDENRLATMEWNFLPLLDKHSSNARPRTLYRHLAEQPEFFCEVIRTIYQSKHEVALGSDEEKQDQDQEADEKRTSMAQNAYRLLMDWDTPPGSLRDSGFSDEQLKAWVGSVKKICVASGHWEVASHQVGEVLYYAPKDESGLWIESVCDLLDSKEDAEYRRGLRIRIFNSRGFHGFSGGKEEVELAEKWERIAAHAEEKGYGRLGSTLRELGKNYREDAKRSVAEHRHEFD